MRLPDFLIIGAAKSGTTSLYFNLKQHPQIYFPLKKEPNFFGLDENYAQGIESYAKLFDAAQPYQVCGEGSTDYTKWPQFPDAAARIAQALPQVKLIYIMRNPVERAYSYYVHINRNQIIQETFEDYISRTPETLDISNYMLQIEQYLQFFPKESFLFLLIEDLIQQPTQTLNQICDFLGVEQIINWAEQSIVANKSQQNFEHTIRTKVTAPLRSLPLVASAVALFPQQWRDQAYKMLQKTAYGQKIRSNYLAEPMHPEMQQILREKFLPLNQRLADFLERDLSHWFNS